MTHNNQDFSMTDQEEKREEELGGNMAPPQQNIYGHKTNNAEKSPQMGQKGGRSLQENKSSLTSDFDDEREVGRDELDEVR